MRKTGLDFVRKRGLLLAVPAPVAQARPAPHDNHQETSASTAAAEKGSSTSNWVPLPTSLVTLIRP